MIISCSFNYTTGHVFSISKFDAFYRPQRSCEGYVFTHVCHSVHEGGAWSWGCLVPGGSAPGGPAWGCLFRGGACSRGSALGEGECGDPPETATVADGTHPTGMHSYYFIVSSVFAKLAILILFSTFYLWNIERAKISRTFWTGKDAHQVGGYSSIWMHTKGCLCKVNIESIYNVLYILQLVEKRE